MLPKAISSEIYIVISDGSSLHSNKQYSTNVYLNTFQAPLNIFSNSLNQSVWSLGGCFDIAKNLFEQCPQTSNKSRTLGGNKIVDHSDVVGASPVGAAPTTSSLST